MPGIERNEALHGGARLNPAAPRNLAASIRQKLLNLATRRGEDFGLVLTRYGPERLLYRLSQSRHCDQFVLKGAMLFQIWSNTPHRPTRDLDLLGHGDPSPENCITVFRELCALAVPDDGLQFPIETVTAEKIKEEQEYEGVRVRLVARMANVRIPLQVDIGFGDALTVRPGVLAYPTLLPMPAPQIQAYLMETVIAEKLEAMVHLGMLNSRMKDFFDVWFLARTFSFDGAALADAIRATFERRGTLDAEVLDTLIRIITQHFLACWREIDPAGSKNRGLHSLMRRHRHNRAPEQAARLEQYFEGFPVMGEIYRFKQRLCYLLLKRHRTRKQCVPLIHRFLKAIHQLRQTGLTQLVQLGKTLAAWSQEIALMWRFTRNNGITEGFHTKMEVLARQAYGFRNFNNYRLRVKIMCS